MNVDDTVVARVARRYVPVTAVVGALCVLIAFAPTLAPTSVSVAVDQPGGTPPSTPTGTGPATGEPGPAASVGPGGTTPGAGAKPASGPGAELGAVPSAGGVSRGGVACGPGARQVPWSVYAPPCRAAFSGDNGGATAHGVTADTITVTYRTSDSTQDAAAFAALGSPNFSDPNYVADLRTYIDLFNNDYELFGRKVELKAFDGTGDWLSEDQGQNLAAAQADASTAHDLGGFADIAFLYKATQPYEQYLARSGVIGLGVPGMPQSFFEANSPWLYSPFPSGDKLAAWATNAVCQHMVGQNASFAGDDAMKAQPRVFGIVTPDIPGYTASGALVEQGFAACGAPVGRRVAYGLNIPTFQNQANSIIAQMRAAGVTTVICYCDPLMPAFLTQTADQQRYDPEWMAATLGPTDQLLRYSSPRQWAHAISNRGAYPAKADSEAYRVFKRASPNGEPREDFYSTAYALVLQLFNGLQAAGPNVTPTNFALGTFSLPPSGKGELGTWMYGSGAFTPGSDTQVGWWSNTMVSEFDGKPGGWQDCAGGAFFPYALDRRAEWGPAGTPLACFP